MNVAIVGSRTFKDYRYLKYTISEFQNINCIVSGGAKGADKLAEKYAKEENIPIRIFEANWKLGRGAGIIRNKTIIENSDVVVAFWDGKSKGTKNTIDTSQKLGVKIIIKYYSTLSKRCLHPELVSIIEDALSDLHWLKEQSEDLHDLRQNVSENFKNYWKSETQFNDVLYYIDDTDKLDIYVAARIANLSMEALPTEWYNILYL